MAEDNELDIINRRKLKQMQKRAEVAAPPPSKVSKSDREILSAVFYDRADEVLKLASEAYPAETESIVRELANLVRSRRFKEKISGGELYSLFRSVGLRFSLNTTIKVQDRGKFVDLSEKLKMKKEGE
ncbi:MAG: double-stranded DNA-binding protein [Thaumarchaeota archaeon]|nr:double-stranded DNA-binding protein [Nitrososphaerota archaeon]